MEGFESSKARTTNARRVVYHFGLTDLLTESSRVWCCRTELPPDCYAKRFTSFFNGKINSLEEPDERTLAFMKKVKDAAAGPWPRTFPKDELLSEALHFTVRQRGRLILLNSTAGLFRSRKEEVEVWLDPERLAFTFKRVTSNFTEVRVLCDSITSVFPSIVKDLRTRRSAEPPSACSRSFSVKTFGDDLRFEAPSRWQMKVWVTALEGVQNMLKSDLPDALPRGPTSVLLGAQGGRVHRILSVELVPSVESALHELNVDTERHADRSHLFRLIGLSRQNATAGFFAKAADGQSVMSARQLQTFLARQGCIASLGEVEGVICESPWKEKLESGAFGLTKQGFAQLLCTPENSIVEQSLRCHDMTLPLTKYWIASSHNTYLEGNQLSGRSSVLQYVDVLHRGARCVEIDCWDGANGEPEVRHGYTATTTVRFSDVVHAVADHAFKSSPYPVVVSIEQHCSTAQLIRQGELMEAVFGDRLLRPPLDEENQLVKWHEATLPSPSEAKGMFIVKSNVCDCTPGAWQYNRCIFMPTMKLKKNSNDLAEFQQSGRVSSGRAPCHCASFEESKLAKWKARELRAGGVQRMQKWHQEFFSRVYPDGTRVTSSNFDPLEAWSVGLQMVALNYQTHDLPMMLNDALFDGGGGYVPKSPMALGAVCNEGVPRVRAVRVHLVSGHGLPRASSHKLLHASRAQGAVDPVSSPCVVISLTTTQSHQDRVSRVVDRDGLGPIFDLLVEFEVDSGVDHTLAFLAFEVVDKALGRPIGHFAAPLSVLRPGVRWVPLKQPCGGPQDAGLLVELMLVTSAK